MSKHAPKKREERLELVEGKVLLGVDIAKKKHWARFRCPDGTLRKTFSIKNHGEGLLKFWDLLLQKLKAMKFGIDDLVVGMEPTGPYWKPLAYFLNEKGVQLVLVSPQKTKIARELDGSPEKSDRKDCGLIVDLMARGTFEQMYLPKDEYAELRQLGVERERFGKMVRQQKSYIISLLDQSFPEWTQVFKDPWIKSSIALLALAGTPEKILSADKNELIDFISKIASNKNRRWAEKKIQALRELAEKSAGVKEASVTFGMCLRLSVRTIQEIEVSLGELEDKMEELTRGLEVAVNLLSFTELGELGLAGLLGEWGELERYDYSGQMESMAGLDLYQVTSGQQEKDDSRIKRKISKRGRPRLRKLLYYIALRCVKKVGCFRDYYMRLIKHGKHKEKALIAVCRKIIRVIFAMFKSGNQFETELHQG